MSDEFVLGVGQAHELEYAFRRTGWNAAEVKVLSMGNNLASVREFILGRAEFKPREVVPPPPKPPVPEPTITTYDAITVDYGMNLKAMIAAGRYDGVNPDITTEHFPIVGKGKVPRVPLTVHFGRDMDDANVTTEFERLGLEDGAIEELTAFGAKYPKLQREFPIIGRKSVWQYRFGLSYCPSLGRLAHGRYLYLFVRERRWIHHCRFLAFRK